MNKVLKIGTRESQLAVWQASLVKDELAKHDIPSELVYIKSDGDIDLVTPLYALGVQGIFTKTLDAALLSNKIDIAVLVTGDGDFVPLVRALMKNGVKVAIAYFKYQEPDGNDSFVNPRLINSANYSININELESNRDFKTDFKACFRQVDENKKTQLPKQDK